MKTQSFALFSLGILWTCLACQAIEFPNEEKVVYRCDWENLQAIELDTGDKLYTPSCFELVPLQGIDSYVGEIISEEEEVYIRFDIGGLAGHYVDPNSANKIEEQSTNETFWYEIRENGTLGGGSCCVYFTFPDVEFGPANFYTYDTLNWVKVLEIMKTYESD